MTSTGSVEKALGLLEFLATIGRPTSLQEATAAMQLSKPTAYRLLGSLQKLGYVTRPHGSREYLIGPRISRLTGSDPFTTLKTAAHPLLQRLNEEFNETVNLGVLSGTRVLYLEFLETSQPLRYIVTPGNSDPYFCTALGRAIAAKLDATSLDRLIAQTDLRPQTSFGTRSKTELKALIKKAADAGYAEESNEAAEGVSCLAVDLASLGFPEAAISVAVPAQRMTPKLKAAIIRNLKSLS